MYQPTWLEELCHTPKTRPQRLGLQALGQSVTSSNINSLQTQASHLL